MIAAVIGFVGKNNAMNDSAAFAAQVKELTEQTETLQADVDEKAASLEEVQAKLTEAEAQVETLTKENETAAADKDQLTKDLEDVKASLEKALAPRRPRPIWKPLRPQVTMHWPRPKKTPLPPLRPPRMRPPCCRRRSTN